MRNIAKYIIGAVIALSVSTAASAAPSTKSDASCQDRYGYYGYSASYCAHDLYGRSSPADLYYGQDRDLVSQNSQQLGRGREGEQYSYLFRGFSRPDSSDKRHTPDRDVG